MGDGAAIGIDLGTTYSCVAAFLRGEPTVLANKMGHQVTPSYVTVKAKMTVPEDDLSSSSSDSDDESDDELKDVGETSKNNAYLNPERAIFDVKRLIGRNIKDPQVQRDLLLWPFEVTHENSCPKIKVDDQVYTPQEISARIFRYLKRCAEDKLNHPVTKVVITVPAEFKRNQRKATKEAAIMAGLQVLRIISEPTAAAIAYNFQYPDPAKRNWLVFDLGGGTFDVAILTTEGSKIATKINLGHPHLGGEDFDNSMVIHCLQQFKEVTGIDLHEKRSNGSPEEKRKVYRALVRLRLECQKQKQFLSAIDTTSVNVTIDAFFCNIDLSVHFDRDLFNRINESHFNTCIQIVQKALRKVQFNPSDIDKVVLVGGSSRIIKIQEMLGQLFGRERITIDIEAEEAVALGAALRAHQLDADLNDDLVLMESPEMRQLTVSDFVARPICVAIKGPPNSNLEAKYTDVIPKFSKIPCSNTIRLFVPTGPDGGHFSVNVYEGKLTKLDWQPLGRFIFNNVPATGQSGHERKEAVDITMDLDEDGILTAFATLPNWPEWPKVILTEEVSDLDESTLTTDLSNLNLPQNLSQRAHSFERLLEQLEAQTKGQHLLIAQPPVKPRSQSPTLTSHAEDTPLQLGIHLDESTITIGSFNFKNSGKFEILMGEMPATIIIHDRQIHLMTPQQKTAQFEHTHQLFDLLIEPSTKFHRILGDFTLRHEELIAAFFIKIIHQIEIQNSARVSHVVLATSFLTTNCQRERLEEAVELAGIEIQNFRLVSSALAIALSDKKIFKNSSEYSTKYFGILEYNVASIKMSIIQIKLNLITVHATYGTEWMKPIKEFSKLHHTLVTSDRGSLDRKEEQLVEVVYKKLWIKVTKMRGERPLEDIYVVTNQRSTGVETILAKILPKPLTGLPANIVQGAAIFASTLAIPDSPFKAHDNPVANIQLQRPNLFSKSFVNFAENFEILEEKRVVFSKTLRLNTKDSTRNIVALFQSFSDEKIVPIASYQVTGEMSPYAKPSNEGGPTVTCTVNQNGVYDLTFETDSGSIYFRNVTAQRLDRPRMHRRHPYKFSDFLDRIQW